MWADKLQKADSVKEMGAAGALKALGNISQAI